MSTNNQLTDAIRAVLNNPNESLCYCDEGWIAVFTDWAEQYRDEYMIVSDREGLYAMAGDAEPHPDSTLLFWSEGLYYMAGDDEPADIVDSLAEHCEYSLQTWLRESLDEELDALEPDEDRATMLRGLIK